MALRRTATMSTRSLGKLTESRNEDAVAEDSDAFWEISETLIGERREIVYRSPPDIDVSRLIKSYRVNREHFPSLGNGEVLEKQVVKSVGKQRIQHTWFIFLSTPPDKFEKDRKKMEPTSVEEKKKEGRNALPDHQNSSIASSDSSLPCIDRLKEELSCPICFDICFEPSTTPCGHSFCKQCLKFAADKCGKRCPKCRQQLISNGRYCIVNTVLWNTIQLLFPQDVEAKKASRAPNSLTKTKFRFLDLLKYFTD